MLRAAALHPQQVVLLRRAAHPPRLLAARTRLSQQQPVRAMAADAGATYDYDLFTIGAGSGGVRASRMSAATGAKVAVRQPPLRCTRRAAQGGG